MKSDICQCVRSRTFVERLRQRSIFYMARLRTQLHTHPQLDDITDLLPSIDPWVRIPSSHLRPPSTGPALISTDLNDVRTLYITQLKVRYARKVFHAVDEMRTIQ